MNPQPLISVLDVEVSSRWYQNALGLQSGHGGDSYERLLYDGKIVLQLHRWNVHEHPLLGNRLHGPAGNGVAVWFQTDHFDAVLDAIRKSEAEIVDGPMNNGNAQHREIWLRDPDSYIVVVAGAYGDLA